MYPLATAEDGQDVAQVEPGEVLVRGFARGQLEGEVGCRRERPSAADRLTSGCHQLEPPRRPLQECDRAGQYTGQPRHNRRTNSQHQAHVVIEGQPRHEKGVLWRDAPAMREVAGNELLEIGQQILIGNLDPGGSTGRPGRILQIHGAFPTIVLDTGRDRSVQIDPVNLDDRWRNIQLLRRNLLGDIVDHRRRRQNDGGRRIQQHCIDALIGGATHRQRKRHPDNARPALHPEKHRCNPCPAESI